MNRQRVLAIGLDGFECTLAEQLMAAGQMPALANLKKRAACFLLETKLSHRTGIPWENFASGLTPETENRWGSLQFNPATYATWQEGAHFTPWWAECDLQAIVFDPPYVDLRSARNTAGIVAWGAHNPGGFPAARPEELLVEFEQKFGGYPAAEWMYANPWPSAARTQMMGEALRQALELRSRAAQWLAAERFPDWDFFFAVPSELHGAMEGLWHGMDARHPLHMHPSAPAAARGLVDLHRALDGMVERLVETAGDATIVAFNMGGMGPNCSDIQSMVLLAELLYRDAFGDSLLTLPPAWTAVPSGLPLLDEDEIWENAASSWVPEPPSRASAERLSHRVLQPVNGMLKAAFNAATRWGSHHGPQKRSPSELDWMPTNRYRRHWPRMPAFALPSFADGRIRINLRGRERHGIVELSRYDETCRSIENLLAECRDPRTDEPAVAKVERASAGSPLALARSRADLRVVWRTVAAAIQHPRLGVIGPVPLHKTGHHTGPYGVAYLAGPGIEPGERGVRSAFDVAPTIVELLRIKPKVRLDGASLLTAPM